MNNPKPQLPEQLPHHCEEPDCPYYEQPSPRSCKCHKTDKEMAATLIVDLVGALQKITEVRGAYSQDHITHMENCLCDMQAIAIDVLKKYGVEPHRKPFVPLGASANERGKP